MTAFSAILAVFLHLDVLLPHFFAAYGSGIYVLLFAVIFAETGFIFTPFLPGDSLLFAAGALCASSGLQVGWLWLFLVIAAFLGDALNYRVGAVFGEQLSSHKWVNPTHLAKAHAYFERYGGKAIILGRFLPIIRTFVPFVCGITQMSYRRFMAYNLIGGLLWVTGFVFAGYWFGQLPWVKAHFSGLILGIMVVSFLPMVVDALRWGFNRSGR